MAKKKKKKATKRSVRRSHSKADNHCTREELRDAFRCTVGGEASLGFVEVCNAATTKPVQEFIVNVFAPAKERSDSEHGGLDVLAILREDFVMHDFAEMPYLRVVGRILDVLLNHRGKETCSAGIVFHVLLDEAPSQSGCDPNDYKLPKPTLNGYRYEVTQQPGRKKVDNRLAKLREKGWADHIKGYVLTPKGKLLFDGWPDLSEIPGLSLTPPLRPRR
jgi:hypothetical protein